MAKTVGIEIEGLDSVLRYMLQLAGGVQSRKLMSEIGFFLMTKIKLRTAEGVDYTETTFDDYSESYAAFREKEGYQTDHVDLFFTGSMMSAMAKEATSEEVRLYFRNTDDKTGTSNASKAAWLNENREFFNLNDNDIDEVTSMVEDYILNKMKIRFR